MADIDLCFSRRLCNLHLATGLTRDYCKRLLDEKRISKKFSQELELVVSEACTNALRHGGNESTNGKVRMTLHCLRDRLAVAVWDQGIGFNLEAVPLPNYEELPEHGYGISIIRANTTNLSYEKFDSVWNVLRFEKSFDV